MEEDIEVEIAEHPANIEESANSACYLDAPVNANDCIAESF